MTKAQTNPSCLCSLMVALTVIGLGICWLLSVLRRTTERGLSVFNLLLQHVALDRERLEDKPEAKVKSRGRLASLRNAVEIPKGLQEAYKQSTKGVMDLINNRFSQRRIKEVPIKTLMGATYEEVKETLAIPKCCKELTNKSLSKQILVSSCKGLQEFMYKHTSRIAFMF